MTCSFFIGRQTTMAHKGIRRKLAWNQHCFTTLDCHEKARKSAKMDILVHGAGGDGFPFSRGPGAGSSNSWPRKGPKKHKNRVSFRLLTKHDKPFLHYSGKD